MLSEIIIASRDFKDRAGHNPTKIGMTSGALVMLNQEVYDMAGGTYCPNLASRKPVLGLEIILLEQPPVPANKFFQSFWLE